MTALRLISAGVVLLFAASGWADTITMKDGRVFAGTYLGGTARQIRVDLGNEVRTFDIGDIARIDFTSTPPPPEPGAAPPMRSDPEPREQPPIVAPDNGPPVLRRSSDSASQSDSTSPPPLDSDRPILRRAGNQDAVLRPDPAAPSQPPGQPGAPVELAAGTNLVVRLNEAVDSQTASQGQSFSANLDQAVNVNGQMAIPRGTEAVLRLVEAQESGKFTGRTELALALISVKIDGRFVNVNTQTVSRVSDSRGERTAKVVGGTAAVGAVIGAIAGGGKGAAVGAGAGAAAGAGAQAVTKGQRVRIPAETRLTFVLDKPVTL